MREDQARETNAKPTIKQRREIKRANQRELEKSHQASVKRRNLITAIVAGVTVIALVALVSIASISAKGHSASTLAPIEGVQLFSGLEANHVPGKVAYNPMPPVGGNHAAAVLNCGIYSEPVPNEEAVHSLEHSAVWVTYDPKIISGTSLKSLQKAMPTTYVILSPFIGLPSPIVASAWGAQLKVSQVGDPRIEQFLAKYRESKSAPEPSAPCTGGINGSGKIA